MSRDGRAKLAAPWDSKRKTLAELADHPLCSPYLKEKALALLAASPTKVEVDLAIVAIRSYIFSRS